MVFLMVFVGCGKAENIGTMKRRLLLVFCNTEHGFRKGS
jgi:hypothetical protein